MTLPQVSILHDCFTDSDLLTIAPTVHAAETVDIFVDGVLKFDDVLPSAGTYILSVPHAPQHSIKVEYVNGSWAGPTPFTTPEVDCETEQAPTTTGAAPTTTEQAPTTTETAPTTTGATTTTEQAPTTTAPATTTTVCHEEDECFDCTVHGNQVCGTSTTAMVAVEPKDSSTSDGQVLPATGFPFGACLFAGACIAAVGWWLHKRPAHRPVPETQTF